MNSVILRTLEPHLKEVCFAWKPALPCFPSALVLTTMPKPVQREPSRAGSSRPYSHIIGKPPHRAGHPPPLLFLYMRCSKVIGQATFTHQFHLLFVESNNPRPFVPG